MSIVIRKAVSGDIDAIAYLEQTCFADPWSRAAISDEIEKNPMSVYIVAEENGTVVGYAGLWQILDEGHITNIAVSGQCRRRGIGDMVVTELIRYSMKRGVAAFTLEVRPSNTGAIRLYENHGFKEEGRRCGYYADGEDAIIMWLYTKESNGSQNGENR